MALAASCRAPRSWRGCGMPDLTCFFYVGGECYNLHIKTGRCICPTPSCEHWRQPLTGHELKLKFLRIYKALSLKVADGKYRNPDL